MNFKSTALVSILTLTFVGIICPFNEKEEKEIYQILKIAHGRAGAIRIPSAKENVTHITQPSLWQTMKYVAQELEPSDIPV